MELKLNDAYKFRYNEEWREKHPYCEHCFDGKLIVRKEKDGKLFLQDTYWGGSSTSRTFTLDKALSQGELTFICNLDEVEKCREEDYKYYNDEDIFNLSSQEGCYKDFYIRKGAERSADKMKSTIKNKIQKTISEIDFANSELERLDEKLKKVNDGDLEVWI